MPLLSVSKLSLGYGDKQVFAGINACEDDGCLIALLGSNGRGKSTLLRTIAGLENIWGSGSILYNGKTLDSYSRKEASSLVSFVSPLADRTKFLSVKDLAAINSYFRTNWIGASDPAEEKRVQEALKMVGMEGFQDRDCTSLSDGEFQRATIAGAIVQDSRIILLDEPTAFLDVANKFLVTRLLKQIAHKDGNRKLIVFSTHDLQLALQICDRLWIMTEEGFFSGSVDQMTESGAIDKMFDVEGLAFDREKMMFVCRDI